MKRKGWLVVLAAALLATLASSPTWAIWITLDPEQPTVADSVKVTFGGVFSDLRWYDASAARCPLAAPETLDVSVDIDYCRGRPSCAALWLSFTYTRTCALAPMPVGAYVVRFTEQHLNPNDPLPTVVTYRSFRVAPNVVPTIRRSWGLIKSAYR